MNLNEIILDAKVLQITAHAKSCYDRETRKVQVDYDQPQDVRFNALFSTREAAEEFAATFPKSAKFQVQRLDGPDSATRYIVESKAILAADGVNGGRNETGIKRYNSILRNAAKLNVPVEFSAGNAVNAYLSLEDLEAAI